METFYHRYLLSTGQYWGSTRTLNDDDCCGYLEIQPPPVEDHYNEIQVWFGDHWEIRPLIDGAYTGE